MAKDISSCPSTDYTCLCQYVFSYDPSWFQPYLSNDLKLTIIILFAFPISSGPTPTSPLVTTHAPIYPRVKLTSNNLNNTVRKPRSRPPPPPTLKPLFPLPPLLPLPPVPLPRSATLALVPTRPAHLLPPLVPLRVARLALAPNCHPVSLAWLSVYALLSSPRPHTHTPTHTHTLTLTLPLTLPRSTHTDTHIEFHDFFLALVVFSSINVLTSSLSLVVLHCYLIPLRISTGSSSLTSSRLQNKKPI